MVWLKCWARKVFLLSCYFLHHHVCPFSPSPSWWRGSESSLTSQSVREQQRRLELGLEGVGGGEGGQTSTSARVGRRSVLWRLLGGSARLSHKSVVQSERLPSEWLGRSVCKPSFSVKWVDGWVVSSVVSSLCYLPSSSLSTNYTVS